MFRFAKPIFPVGKSETLNVYAVFRTRFTLGEEPVLRLTASSFYRVWVNGQFAGFGPARTAGGYARVDELPLSAYAKEGENELLIEVVGHHCRSLSTVIQPSYLWAELLCGEDVIAYTGRDFEAFLPCTRLQKTERYSVQRHFSEVWDLSLPAIDNPTAVEVLTHDPIPLARRVDYPHYEDIALSAVASHGKTEYDAERKINRDFYSFPTTDWGAFAREEVLYHPYEWIQSHRQIRTAGRTELPLILNEGEYAIFDLGRIETGFLRLSAAAVSACELVIGFSEDSSPDAFAFTDMHAHNAMELLLPAGEQKHFMSFEPYVLRYAIVAAAKGNVNLSAFGIKTFEHGTEGLRELPTGDDELDAICKSAVRTFCHNAVDIYMDCPSRERAGWLCDSYFTAQVEYELFGKSTVEDTFLENFRLYRENGDYPTGVLPMCYPADAQLDKKFIPQWTMWYILELGQYLTVRNPSVDRELYRPSVMGLMSFYQQYENADGLLERLPSWNFVEWSVANQWTWDISYPTNLLYAAVLDTVAMLYGDETLRSRADRIRRLVMEQSFNGEVFRDHAIRDAAGNAIVQSDCSEACQYYALLFGNYDWNDPAIAKLRRLVTEVFGSRRNGQRSDIAEVNAFIGAYLRLEALLKVGEFELIPTEVKYFFGSMSDETQTLWEYRQRHGSRDHGFASYALVALRRAGGIARQAR